MVMQGLKEKSYRKKLQKKATAKGMDDEAEIILEYTLRLIIKCYKTGRLLKKRRREIRSGLKMSLRVYIEYTTHDDDDDDDDVFVLSSPLHVKSTL